MKQINQSSVKDAITKRGKWSGFLAASKDSHQQGLWCLGISCTIRSLDELEIAIKRISHLIQNGDKLHIVSFYERAID